MKTKTVPEYKFIDSNNPKEVAKIIALWGFSEATLGGILHALNIPFTGIFIGSTAVLLISLLASLSEQRGMIIKATLIVLTIKGMVSPHTPLTAYAAVLLQGIIGQLLFGIIKQKKMAAFLFGIIAMLLSAFQKLIILTVVFGNTLWESIDIYASFVINQFLFAKNNPDTFKLSFILMGIYLGLHLFTGFMVGIIAGKLPRWIEDEKSSTKLKSILSELEEIRNNNNGKKKKLSWWRKKSGVAFILMMLIMLGLSYLYPEFGSGNVYKIVLMILRSTIIMVVWFFLLSPFLLKMFRKYLSKKQKSYSTEIEQIVNLFPHIKSIIKSSWNNSKEYKKLKRLKAFLSTTLVLMLISEFE